MRSGIIGFLLGACLVAAGVVFIQQRFVNDVVGEVHYRFDQYVFAGPEFPKGDFDDGRLVHRFLIPAKATVTFYDAQFQEVARAEKPGRYGAVVRMKFGFCPEKIDYITLYRTPMKVQWWDTKWPVQMPPEAGIDPAVVTAQASQINDLLQPVIVGDSDEPSRRLAVLLAGLSETSPQDPAATRNNGVVGRDADWWYDLRKKIGRPIAYPYFVDVPSGYDADPAKRWPLILYLHAGVERGTDLKIVHITGLPRVIREGRQLAALVLAPQCPPGEWWNSRALAQLLDDVAAKYRVDPDRVYMSGGTGVWSLALSYPERFAAINPISGASDPAAATRLANMPIWSFRNTRDDNLAIVRMLEAIQKAGGHPHLTTVDSQTVDPWDVAYATDALYPWLLAQKKGQAEVMTPGLPKD